MSCEPVIIGGREYRAVEPTTTSNRAVVVVDRGWIFAGDVTEIGGRIKLSRAVWVLRWESVGFDGVLDNPKSVKVMIKPMKHTVDIPLEAEIFRVPVADDWGF